MKNIDSVQNATITIRLIRSFECKIVKHLVMKDVNLNMTVEDFKKLVHERLENEGSLHNSVKCHTYDSLLVHFIPNVLVKSSNPLINYDCDYFYFMNDMKKTLLEYRLSNFYSKNIGDESEISYFNMEQMLHYKHVQQPYFVQNNDRRKK